MFRRFRRMIFVAASLATCLMLARTFPPLNNSQAIPASRRRRVMTGWRSDQKKSGAVVACALPATLSTAEFSGHARELIAISSSSLTLGPDSCSAHCTAQMRLRALAWGVAEAGDESTKLDEASEPLPRCFPIPENQSSNSCGDGACRRQPQSIGPACPHRCPGDRRLGHGSAVGTRAPDFWEICEDRNQVRSTILTSQLPVSRWHEQIGDPRWH